MRRIPRIGLLLGTLLVIGCATNRNATGLDNSRFLRANRSGGFPISVPTRTPARAAIRT